MARDPCLGERALSGGNHIEHTAARSPPVSCALQHRKSLGADFNVLSMCQAIHPAELALWIMRTHQRLDSLHSGKACFDNARVVGGYLDICAEQGAAAAHVRCWPTASDR